MSRVYRRTDPLESDLLERILVAMAVQDPSLRRKDLLESDFLERVLISLAAQDTALRREIRMTRKRLGLFPRETLQPPPSPLGPGHPTLPPLQVRRRAEPRTPSPPPPGLRW